MGKYPQVYLLIYFNFPGWQCFVEFGPSNVHIPALNILCIRFREGGLVDRDEVSVCM